MSGWIGGSRADVIEELIYEHDKLLRINRTALANETIHFFYDINKRLGVTKNEDNETVGLKLEYLDGQARDTLTYALVFGNSYTIKDTVHQVHLSKTQFWKFT